MYRKTWWCLVRTRPAASGMASSPTGTTGPNDACCGMCEPGHWRRERGRPKFLRRCYLLTRRPCAWALLILRAYSCLLFLRVFHLHLHLHQLHGTFSTTATTATISTTTPLGFPFVYGWPWSDMPEEVDDILHWASCLQQINIASTSSTASRLLCSSPQSYVSSWPAPPWLHDGTRGVSEGSTL